MILLGLDAAAKAGEVARYVAAHAIRRVFVLSPTKFRFPLALDGGPPVEWFGFDGSGTAPEIVQYTVYYRLLQEIDRDTLVVVNECLRAQNRYELAYNCTRLFLQQTPHALICQYLPLIDTLEDFAVLFDFETRSRWKRHKLTPALLGQAEVRVDVPRLDLRPVEVPTDDALRAAYAREKRKLIDGIGPRDPHTIPRNLYLMSGKARLGRVEPGRHYVGRNNRFKIPTLVTFDADAFPRRDYVVFELPHDFIRLADFLALSRQTEVDVLVADLKVDRWYLTRYMDWARRVDEACSVLRG